jgi:hypothetical protein
LLAKSGPIFEKNSLKPSAMSSEFVKLLPLILNSFTFVGLFCLPSKFFIVFQASFDFAFDQQFSWSNNPFWRFSFLYLFYFWFVYTLTNLLQGF